MTVLTLNIHHGGNNGREVPAIIRTICLDYLARLFCIKVDLHDKLNTSQVGTCYLIYFFLISL